MAFDEHEEEQSRLLRQALIRADISVGKLWLRYFSIGGNVGEYEIQAYLAQLMSLPALERNILAHAANELIDERPPLPRAPYTDDLAGPRDRTRQDLTRQDEARQEGASRDDTRREAEAEHHGTDPGRDAGAEG